MHPLLADLDEYQYADLYHVDDAPLADFRRATLSRMGWCGVALTVLAIGLGATVSFPDMTRTDFVVRSEGSEAIYRFPSAVYIEKIHVRAGQQIRAGQPLFDISAPDIAALVNDWTTAQNNRASFRQFRTVSATNEQAILTVSRTQAAEAVALKALQGNGATQQWRFDSVRLAFEQHETERLLTMNRQFYRDGDISKNDLQVVEATQLRARTAFQSAYQHYRVEQNLLVRQVVIGQLAMVGIDRQQAKGNSDLALEANRLEGAVRVAGQRIESSFGPFEVTADHHLRVKARRSGLVSFVFDGEKEVPVGTILFRLSGSKTTYYAHAQVSSSQIGRVELGQAVVLKLVAYPVFEWGTIRGVISNVSLTPDEKGLFNVQIRLTDYGRLRHGVRVGMRGESSLIFAERTVFGHLFHSFQKTTSDILEASGR